MRHGKVFDPWEVFDLNKAARKVGTFLDLSPTLQALATNAYPLAVYSAYLVDGFWFGQTH